VACFRSLAVYAADPGAIAVANKDKPGVKPDGVNRRMAPVNLGYLLDGGYVGDWTVFYCPSGAGAQSWGDPKNKACYGGWGSLQNIAQVRRAVMNSSKPSAGSRALFYGDFSYANWGQYCDEYGKWGWIMAAAGQYNYRGVVYGAYDSYGRGTAQETSYIAGTRPVITGRFGAQIFGTTKNVSSRALLCDTFEKCRVTSSDTQADLNKAGRESAGFQMHKDGYNVLYGDGHAAWYGDPQQRIIWWMAKDQYTPSESNMHCGTQTWDWCVRSYTDSRFNDYSWYAVPASHVRRLNNGWLVWHLMDVAGGEDVDAYYREGSYNQ